MEPPPYSAVYRTPISALRERCITVCVLEGALISSDQCLLSSRVRIVGRRTDNQSADSFYLRNMSRSPRILENVSIDVICTWHNHRNSAATQASL